MTSLRELDINCDVMFLMDMLGPLEAKTTRKYDNVLNESM